jgi:hypothetical protein
VQFGDEKNLIETDPWFLIGMIQEMLEKSVKSEQATSSKQ